MLIMEGMNNSDGKAGVHMCVDGVFHGRHGTLCHRQVAGDGILVEMRRERCYIGSEHWARYYPQGGWTG